MQPRPDVGVRTPKTQLRPPRNPAPPAARAEFARSDNFEELTLPRFGRFAPSGQPGHLCRISNREPGGGGEWECRPPTRSMYPSWPTVADATCAGTPNNQAREKP